MVVFLCLRDLIYGLSTDQYIISYFNLSPFHGNSTGCAMYTKRTVTLGAILNSVMAVNGITKLLTVPSTLVMLVDVREARGTIRQEAVLNSVMEVSGLNHLLPLPGTLVMLVDVTMTRGTIRLGAILNSVMAMSGLTNLLPLPDTLIVDVSETRGNN